MRACMCMGERSGMNILAVIRLWLFSNASSSCQEMEDTSPDLDEVSPDFAAAILSLDKAECKLIGVADVVSRLVGNHQPSQMRCGGRETGLWVGFPACTEDGYGFVMLPDAKVCPRVGHEPAINGVRSGKIEAWRETKNLPDFWVKSHKKRIIFTARGYLA